MLFFFFFKQKTAYEMRISDWSSDVCSSDLRRDQTRREHLVEIRRSHGFRIFDRDAFREVVAFSIPIAQTIIHPGQMAGVIVDALRRRQILLPSSSILEAVLRRGRQQAEHDRKRVVGGERVSVRVALVGRCSIKKKNKKQNLNR